MKGGRDRDEIKRAAKLLKEAGSIIFLCGAGMGVDSGIEPKDGYGLEGHSPYHMSKYSTLCNEPHLFWGYQVQRARAFKQATPHIGYNLLKEMMLVKTAIFTSNIDEHCARVFQEDKYNLLECHGSIGFVQTFEHNGKIWKTIEEDVNAKVDQYTGNAKTLPNRAGMAIRFNVLYIGDEDFCRQRLNYQEKRFHFAVSDMQKAVIIEIGAGTGIPTVRRKSGELSQKLDAPVIRINLDQPDLYIPNIDTLPKREDHVSIGGMGAKEALEQIYLEWKILK